MQVWGEVYLCSCVPLTAIISCCHGWVNSVNVGNCALVCVIITQIDLFDLWLSLRILVLEWSYRVLFCLSQNGTQIATISYDYVA